MIETKLKTLMRAGVVAQATFIVGLALIPCQTSAPTGSVQNTSLASVRGFAADPFDTRLTFADLKEVTAQKPRTGDVLVDVRAQTILKESQQRIECAKKREAARSLPNS